ncbi:MAG: NADPH:quinone reductase [Verrucomicrobiales bacterium]
MKAAYIEDTGPASNLRYGDLPDLPPPSGRQVLVKVGAAALNPVDTFVRSGAIEMPLPKPFIVGCDLAGEVVAAGPEAVRFKPGDRVWGSNQGLLGRQGTFAEFVCSDEDWLYPTPDDVSDADAAAMALVGITAHLGVVQRGRLAPGETALVIGGTGGVGSAVVGMAKAIGARVIATAGGAEKAALARRLGADEVIDYTAEDIAARVKELAPHGVDLFWETRLQPDFDLAVDLLARRGRMILMAGRKARAEFPVGPFYVKGAELHGFVMFLEPADAQRAAAGDINRWMAEGKLRANIDRTLPLAAAAEAHRLQEESTAGGKNALHGKIVVVP